MAIQTRRVVVCDHCDQEIEGGGISVPNPLKKAAGDRLNAFPVQEGDYHTECLVELLRGEEKDVKETHNHHDTMILDRLKLVIKNNGFGLDRKTIDDIGLNTDLEEDLNFDSLDHLEFIMMIEEKFDIEIRDDEAVNAGTLLKDIVKMVKELS